MNNHGNGNIIDLEIIELRKLGLPSIVKHIESMAEFEIE